MGEVCSECARRGAAVGENYTEVRYEALLRDPLVEFGRLF